METTAPRSAPVQRRGGRPRSTSAPSRRTQAERRQRTRSELLRAARELFASQGYAATGREEIAERAGVTRGALYHHFESKQELFAAVVRDLDDEVTEQVLAKARRAAGPAAMIRAGARAYIDACSTPAVARITTDAASVLGAAEYRAVSGGSCLGLLHDALEQSARQHPGAPVDSLVLATMILGALNEAALVVASSARPEQVRRSVGKTVDAFLARLLAV